MMARTSGSADRLLGEMQRALLAMEPNLLFVDNQTMDAQIGATLYPMRAGATLLSGAGLVALALASVGLYGVIAYSVARRTREIGIRIELGAERAWVLGLIMRQGLAVAVAGLLAGCALAAGAAYVLSGVLYGVSPADPVAWGGAAAALLGIAALANLLPARRAARVEPTVALRTD
jgi:ABC-type antimicrobial peptide transport system permease subunit